MALKYEVNEIKIDLASYRHYMRGIPKIGKTTFFRDFIMELYGDPKYGLLISLGQESGFKALSKITKWQCLDWASFVEVVDDLVEDKEGNEFRFVCLDTVDRVFEIAEKRVLEIHKSIKGEAAYSIDSALGGYAKGKKKAKTLVEEQVARLENAGYGMFWLGHTKLKTVGDQVTDVTYEKVTGSLEFSYDSLFSDRADLTTMLATESIAKDDKLKEAKRFIYFRSNPNIDAGSRIGDQYFPEKIEYSARGYIDTVTKALEAAAGVTGKDADKRRKDEEKERIEVAKEFSRKQKEEKVGDETVSVEDYKKQLAEIAAGLSPEEKDQKKAELKKAGLAVKFSDIEDMSVLRKYREIFTNSN
jgi:hypothetical protein